jgi:hypothetical protein
VCGHNAPKQYKLLNNSTLARQFINWQTGIKGNKARDYIQHAVQVRSANYNGGISSVTKNLETMSRVSDTLKWTGRGMIGVELVAGSYKAYDAYAHGDQEGGNIEVGKTAGSILGGTLAGETATYGARALLGIFGVGTGGVGFVLVGIAVLTAGYYGGKGGEWIGQEGAEMTNNGIKKYYDEQVVPTLKEVFE